MTPEERHPWITFHQDGSYEILGGTVADFERNIRQALLSERQGGRSEGLPELETKNAIRAAFVSVLPHCSAWQDHVAHAVYVAIRALKDNQQ